MTEPTNYQKAKFAMGRVEAHGNQNVKWLDVKDCIGALVYSILALVDATKGEK